MPAPFLFRVKQLNKTKQQTRRGRRLERGLFEGHLAVYDGSIWCGLISQSGERFHAYDVKGRPAGVFDNLRAAVRSFPRVPESAA
jgi:hypothetical protein